jgi:Fe-Mn family superoxide dismutase
MRVSTLSLFVFSTILSLPGYASLKSLNALESPFELASLPYAANSLEPFIDRETMTIHHDLHHQAYVDTLNDNLKESGVTMLEIFNSASQKTDKVRNNAGGHWNHTFFWEILSRNQSDNTIPKKLEKEIENTFGSMKKFKAEFEAKGKDHFGSGWVWLIRNDDGNLEITSTPNQDNPLMNDALVRGFPILGADVWEHAYYLKYRNERAKYLEAFWNVVNWKRVYELSEESKDMKLAE